MVLSLPFTILSFLVLILVVELGIPKQVSWRMPSWINPLLNCCRSSMHYHHDQEQKANSGREFFLYRTCAVMIIFTVQSGKDQICVCWFKSLAYKAQRLTQKRLEGPEIALMVAAHHSLYWMTWASKIQTLYWTIRIALLLVSFCTLGLEYSVTMV